ncbi:hypothetical protein MRX96_020370 [Rhipicephalus microplus]
MQANVVFASCALLRLRKSTTDVTTSTHGRITVLPRASQGGVSGRPYKRRQHRWTGIRADPAAARARSLTLSCFLMQAKLRKLSSTVCKLTLVFASCALLRLRKVYD